jgi:hypothetical protein
MSRSFKRTHRPSRTSFKTYLQIFVACGVITLLMQAVVSLTDSAKEGLEKATEGAIAQVVKSELEKELMNQVRR